MRKYILITGGAGFIGANLACRLLLDGESVRLFDDLSRTGVERNVEWLRDLHGGRAELTAGDVRDPNALRAAIAGASQVYHLAAAVGAARSRSDPHFDFEVNAYGTLNVLEALREMDNPPPLCFTSTKQVYGSLRRMALCESTKRYEPSDERLRRTGISESQPLDFHDPHACSKGTADQYVLAYAQTFGLRAVVLRLSCVFGPRQYGNEDQGWAAHLLKRSLAGEPVTIWGNGKQARDLLFVDDAVEALLAAQSHMRELSGHAFNVGGGPDQTMSLLELLDVVEELAGEGPDVTFVPEREGDQRYYASDTRRFASATGWSAHTDVRQGLRELYLWLSLPYERRRTVFAPLESLR